MSYNTLLLCNRDEIGPPTILKLTISHTNTHISPVTISVLQLERSGGTAEQRELLVREPARAVHVVTSRSQPAPIPFNSRRSRIADPPGGALVLAVAEHDSDSLITMM